jgi:hypothetical protein
MEVSKLAQLDDEMVTSKLKTHDYVLKLDELAQQRDDLAYE